MKFTKVKCAFICGWVLIASSGCDLSPRAKHGPRITSYTHLYELGLAIREYEHQHGKLPPQMSALVPLYIPSNRIAIFYVTNKFAYRQTLPPDWKDNLTQIDRFSSYVYLGTNRNGNVIAYEKTNLWKSTAPNANKVAVLFSDFSVQYVPIAALQNQIRGH